MSTFSGFQYIAHVNNLKEILEDGILSHNKVVALGKTPEMISNPQVMELRKNREVDAGKTLWDYANVYFKARNAMLWQIIDKYGAENVVVLGLRPTITRIEGAKITDGNAASHNSEIFSKSQLKEVLGFIREDMNSDWWKAINGSKRKMMAECLIPDKIPPEYISSIHIVSSNAKQKVQSILGEQTRYGLITSPGLFFQAETRAVIDNISILQGDMFFSKMQTLTISVNTVGVMGKGLASRARYQFPDVFVHYQDLCRENKLRMGAPILYKRDIPIEELFGADFIDEKESTWFLLFPTKTHFRYNSDLEGIKKGLIWIKENYEKLGIKSLALPALGCGLGKLSWSQIGPLMVKQLKETKIPIAIYLPAEKDIEAKHIESAFLLGN